MKGFEKIVGDIYRLETSPEGVWNGVVLVDGKEKILIDSGIDAKNVDELLVPALQEMGYQLSDIKWLCNTHCHGDHVGGHKRIVELGNVKTAVYCKSVDKIRNPLKYSKLIRAAFPENSPRPPAVLEGVQENVIMQDGTVLAERLQVIAAPGHDDDCICFYDLKSKTLITGDSLQGNGTESQGTALYMNLIDYTNSINKLKEMDICNIVSGHPYLITGDKAIGKEEAELYLRRCEDIVCTYHNFIKDSWKAGERNIASIAKQLILHMKNKKPNYLFLPMYTVRAHIEEIKKELNGGNKNE